MSSLLVLNMILYYRAFQAVPLKSVVLTPFNSTQEGASVIVLDTSVTINSDSWNITMDDQEGWQMVVQSDEYGFHATLDSVIRIEIDGAYPDQTDCDLIFAFSVDNSQYFAVEMFMDNASNNRISPSCNGSSMWIDNATSSVPSDSTERWIQTSNNKYTDFGEQTDGHNNDWPIQFELENNIETANEFWIIHNNPSWNSYEQECGFNTLFPTQKGLDIFIGGGVNNQQCIIQSFTIQLEYALTTTSSPMEQEPDSEDNRMGLMLFVIIGGSLTLICLICFGFWCMKQGRVVTKSTKIMGRNINLEIDRVTSFSRDQAIANLNTLTPTTPGDAISSDHTPNSPPLPQNESEDMYTKIFAPSASPISPMTPTTTINFSTKSDNDNVNNQNDGVSIIYADTKTGGNGDGIQQNDETNGGNP
eukprot:303409_1